MSDSVNKTKGKSFYKFSNYPSITTGAKRLDFIVDSIYRYQGKLSNSQVSILEVGCGTGNITIPIASLAYNILGVDFDKDSIAFSERLNQFPNASFLLKNVFDLDTEKHYDFIISSEFFEHVQNPLKLAGIIYNLLKSDGILLVTVPNGGGPYELSERILHILQFLGLAKTLRFFRRLLMKISLWPFPNFSATLNVEDRHIQFYTFKKIKDMLQKCGFVILEVKHSDVLANVFPFSIISMLCPSFARLDQKLADHLPHSFVSGWYILAKKGI